MRLSRGSASALAAVLLVALAFRLETGRIGGQAPAFAQEKKAERPRIDQATRHPPVVLEPGPLDHPLSSDLARQTKVEARITAALNQPIDFVIERQSMKDAISFIAAHCQIPILFDQKALEDANVDTSCEVELNAPGILLKDALCLLLGQTGRPLDYDVVRDVLTISTVDKINEHVKTVV
jgi:hypothetical protein